MNSSQKINLNEINREYDKHIKIKLENEIETLEFLSIKINSTDIYQSFNADYGVLVGRVVANNGIGVPNAKISIFIPLDEEDEINEEIKYIYPYKNPRDKNNEGKRYNLLPRVGKIDQSTGVVRPQQAFGSFPIKEEIVTNVNHLNIYKKYYKYTALTNQYGDYMIFGTPTGTQTVHMSLDITDIGEYSMTPASMVTNLGYSENLFINNNTRIKPSDDLNDLPHIETQDITVDIIPFWGDSDNYDIGITRQDFRVRTTLNNTFTIFGNLFTDGKESAWACDDGGSMTPNDLFKMRNDEDLNIICKRIGKVKETIYYYPNTLTDNEINTAISGNTEINREMLILDKTEYSRYVDESGLFCFIISCNRKKIIRDENNNIVNVEPDFNGGIFTEFRGFIVFEVDEDSAKIDFTYNIGNDRGKIDPFRFKLKVPQSSILGKTFDSKDDENSTIWRNQHFTFKGGNIYSVSRFHGLSHYEISESGSSVHFDDTLGLIGGTSSHGKPLNEVNLIYDGQNERFNVGIIETKRIEKNYYDKPSNYVGTLDNPLVVAHPDNPVILESSELSGYTTNAAGSTTISIVVNVGDSAKLKLEKNYTINDRDYFGANWLNLSLYFPQIGEMTTNLNRVQGVRSNTLFTKNFHSSTYYYEDNQQEIGAKDTNTKFFGRSDLNQTNFIKVTKDDIKTFSNIDKSGFKISGLTGEYMNITTDPNYYFYKGFGVDCIKFLKKIGIV